MKFSPNFPSVPLSYDDLASVVAAIRRFPITGDPVLDFRLMMMTGLLESRFASGTIKAPNSTALGYFQMIKKTRDNISKVIGIPWDSSLATQALFAAYGYHELARMIKSRAIPSYQFLPDPLANYLANIRFRYAVGTGNKYYNTPEAKTFLKLMLKHYNFLAMGDFKSDRIKAQLIFMHPILAQEFDSLPIPVIDTIGRLIQGFEHTKWFVSSVKSNQQGHQRTQSDGPNHFQHKAIDIVPTPFDTPMFFDQEGKPRSPHFNWNVYLIKHLSRMNRKNPFLATVLVEPDHIHIDSTHAPGLVIAEQDKACYANNRPPSDLATPYKLRRL